MSVTYSHRCKNCPIVSVHFLTGPPVKIAHIFTFHQSIPCKMGRACRFNLSINTVFDRGKFEPCFFCFLLFFHIQGENLIFYHLMKQGCKWVGFEYVDAVSRFGSNYQLAHYMDSVIDPLWPEPELFTRLFKKYDYCKYKLGRSMIW